MTAEPRQAYVTRSAYWSGEIVRHESRHVLVSNLRLALVALTVLVLWLALSRGLLHGEWALIPVLLFLVLMVVHARVLNARDRAMRALAYYERGVGRLDDAWRGVGDPGERFLNDHSYARDLDLFGHASVFQLLNTARTESGEERLAQWLRTPAPLPEVLERQAAVAELRDVLDFREALAVFAADARVSRTGALARWTQMTPAGLGTLHAWLLAAAGLLSAAAVTATVLEWIPLVVGLAGLAPAAAVTLAWRRHVERAIGGVDAAAYDLALLQGLLERVEGRTFVSPRLRAIHAALVTEGVAPSRRLAQLGRYLAARDAVRNEFVRPFAMVLLVRSQAAVAIDRWHTAHRGDLAAWLDGIGELEALCSLGTFAFEHPDDPFPVLEAGAPVMIASAIAHPLLPVSVAVANDVSLGGAGPQLLIVSGSNMSGKSTLLRAIGVNVVLALAGAPVRAARMTLSPLTLGATLRVQDSLDDGQSRFYAEILRIRDIVVTARGEPVLFLLDEILAGTNSHDRRIGAGAIVQSLIDSGAIGIVTTHDLALTAMADTLPARARNVHFEDRLEAGRLIFDYTMRDGVVERSNALELMRAVGISV